MFIALPSHSFALQRSAMYLLRISLHAAPNGADTLVIWEL